MNSEIIVDDFKDKIIIRDNVPYYYLENPINYRDILKNNLSIEKLAYDLCELDYINNIDNDYDNDNGKRYYNYYNRDYTKWDYNGLLKINDTTVSNERISKKKYNKQRNNKNKNKHIKYDIKAKIKKEKYRNKERKYKEEQYTFYKDYGINLEYNSHIPSITYCHSSPYDLARLINFVRHGYWKYYVYDCLKSEKLTFQTMDEIINLYSNEIGNALFKIFYGAYEEPTDLYNVEYCPISYYLYDKIDLGIDDLDTLYNIKQELNICLKYLMKDNTPIKNYLKNNKLLCEEMPDINRVVECIVNHICNPEIWETYWEHYDNDMSLCHRFTFN